MERTIKLTTLVVAAASLCWASVAMALGLGPLRHDSALNEPFKGRIELVDATADELEDLKVRIAPLADFRKAGLERPLILSSLRLRVVREGGRAWVEVTSSEPIREPFLDFLVEAVWPNGRLLREYTVLLDPPVYAERLQQVTRAGAAQPAPAPATAPQPRPAPRHALAGQYMTRPGDTLWSLARDLRPDPEVTIQQMMLALLRANPQAFLADNVNALKGGYVLRVPSREEILAISPQQAIAEVRRQNAEWPRLRERLLAGEPVAATPAAEPTAPAPAGGATEPAVEPATAAPPAEGQLKIVSPEEAPEAAVAAAPGGGEGAAGSDQELALVREQLSEASRENKALRQRLSEAEELIDSLQRMVTLREDELAALQQRLAEAGVAVPESGGPVALDEGEGQSAETAAGEEPLAARPAAEPEAAPEETPPQGGERPAASEGAGWGWLAGAAARVPGGMTTLFGLGGLLVLILAALLVVRRRGAAVAPESGPAAATAGALAAPAAATATAAPEPEPSEAPTEVPATAPPEPEVELQRTPQFETPASEVVVEQEEDPLAEVNVYLAYERFDQAEELVRQAIEQEPENLSYRLRLLEVYYAANNKPAYEAAAAELRELTGGEGPIWESALAMWQEMSPDRALFEEAGEATLAAEATAAPEKAFVDLTGESLEGTHEDATLVSAPGAGETAAGEAEQVPAEAEGTPEIELDITGALTDEGGAAGAGAGAEEVLDITGEGEASAGGTEEELLDLTAEFGGEAAAGDELLDVTATGDAEELDQGEALLDVTAPGLGEEPEAPSGGGEGRIEVPSAGEGEQDNIIEFELTTGPGAEQSGEAGEAVDAGEVLDITGGGDRAPEPVAEAEDNLIEFDLTGGDTRTPPPSEEEEVTQTLDLTGGAGDEAEGGQTDFDVTGLAVGDEEGAAPSDLDLDIDTLSLTEGPGEPEAEEEPLDIDLADSLIEDQPPEGATAARGESSDEDLSLEDLAAELENTISSLSLSAGGEQSEQPAEGAAAGGDAVDTEIIAPAGGSATGSGDESTVALPGDEAAPVPEDVDARLDLAKAYMELGDGNGARALLEDVVREGNDAQRAEAERLLQQIG